MPDLFSADIMKLMSGIIGSQNDNDLLRDAPEPSPEAPEDTPAEGPILTVDKGTFSPVSPENEAAESLAISRNGVRTGSIHPC